MLRLTVQSDQKLTTTQLTRYLRAATCPYCGGRLSGRHARSEDGWRSLPMIYGCTVCGRNPREALANDSQRPAGRAAWPEGEATMSKKKAEKTKGKQKGEETYQETTKGYVHAIAKPRSTPLTGRPKDAPDAATIEAARAGESTPTRNTIPQTPDDASEIVVFAFRLSRAERDEIHAATGSAKASKFIRTLALAGARGDMKAVQEAIDEVHATRK